MDCKQNYTYLRSGFTSILLVVALPLAAQTTTTINFNTPAITPPATTLSAAQATAATTTWLTQGIEFVEPNVQPLGHPIQMSYAGARVYLDPTHAHDGKQVLASYAQTDELLEQLAGFLIHLTKYSDKVSLYAGAYVPNDAAHTGGGTVQLTGYDADGNIVANTTHTVTGTVSTLLSINTTKASIAYVSVQIPGLGSPQLEVDDLSFETPAGAALTNSSTAIDGIEKVLNDPLGGIFKLPAGIPSAPLVVPKILSVTQGVGNPVIIVGDKPFTDAAAVYFGTVEQPSIDINGNTIAVWAPAGVLPGSNADISVLLKNSSSETMAYSRKTSEVPIGTVNETGPLLANPYDYVGDDAWAKGQGHSFALGSPKNLFVDIPYPVIYLNGTFEYTEQLESKYPLGLTTYAGNIATFTGTLEMCSIAQSSATPDGACKNWDGTSGTWVKEGATVKKSIKAKTGQVYFGLPTGTAIFDGKNYIRTLRVLVGVAQTDTQGGAGFPIRSTTTYTDPFNIIVSPMAYYQIKVQPELIIYAPPGDQSTTTFAASANYFTSYTNGNSSSQTNTTTDSDNNSWTDSFSMTAGYKGGSTGGGASASASFNVGGGNGMDTTTTAGSGVQNGATFGGSSAENLGITYGPTQANVNTTPGRGMVCSPTSCATQTQVANWWQNQPFWNDTFYLQIHPQYAYYVLGNNTDRSVMYASINGYSKLQVLNLWACAAGKKLYGLDQCTVSYIDSTLVSKNGQTAEYVGVPGSVVLSPTEANNLLKLDPFYIDGQGAGLSVNRASLIAPNVNYGSRIGETVSNPQSISYNNTQVVQKGQTGQTTYTSGITNSYSITNSSGFSFSAAFLFGVGVGETNTDTSTYSSIAQNQSVYSNSTAGTATKVVTITGALNDVDNVNGGGSCKTCHNPLATNPSVNVYLDRTFGGFMFQDSNANPAPSAAQRTTWESQFNVAAMSVIQESNNQRFGDVPSSSPMKVAIGMMARLGILSGYADGDFHPNDPITRAQFAAALKRVLSLAPPAKLVSFTDVAATSRINDAAGAAVSAGLLSAPGGKFSPTDPVSLDDFHTALVHAFKVPPATTSTGSAPQTRGQAAQLLFTTLEANN